MVQQIELTLVTKNASKESFAKGEAKGKSEGKDERSLEVARAMKAKGMDAALIAELTGLDADKINTL